MCSRYFLDADGNVIAYTFRVPADDRVRRRYNIAPTQDAPIVRRNHEGARVLDLARWGLVPFWAKDARLAHKMINARSETVLEKPAFRNAFRERRCLVPATGFFEWRGAPGAKQPYAITAPGLPLFAFAGLWERCKLPDDRTLETFTILTTDANETVAPIHDRMPVILSPEEAATWLEGGEEEARALLHPSVLPMRVRAVTRLASDPRIDTPQVLADAPPTLGL